MHFRCSIWYSIYNNLLNIFYIKHNNTVQFYRWSIWVRQKLKDQLRTDILGWSLDIADMLFCNSLEKLFSSWDLGWCEGDLCTSMLQKSLGFLIFLFFNECYIGFHAVSKFDCISLDLFMNSSKFDKRGSNYNDGGKRWNLINIHCVCEICFYAILLFSSGLFSVILFSW